MKLNPLVHNVIWPAVAGSILWTFLQVAADPNSIGPRTPRLAALLVVGVYLAIDWVNTDQVGSINEKYWRYDMPIAGLLATFAVGLQFGSQWAAWPLAAAFAIAIIGHLFGAWDKIGVSSSRKARVTMAGFNTLGLMLLLIGMFVKQPYGLWLTPIAAFSVVVLFLVFRTRLSTW
jgi:hypothetical protein